MIANQTVIIKNAFISKFVFKFFKSRSIFNNYKQIQFYLTYFEDHNKFLNY